MEKEQKVSCPSCHNNIKPNLSLLKMSNGTKCISKLLDNYEFFKLFCKGCELNFTFILCLFCNKQIYMKIHPVPVECNGMNGYNISCPHKSCGKIFYLTKCPKCQLIQKIDSFIKEGQIIQCQNDNCKYQYIQINCALEYCTDSLSSERPKINTNYPNGILFVHKKEIIFQKIFCCYCSRPICFASKKGHKNKYYEGQQVVCPYEDCKEVFNRVICPNCVNEIYINDGWYKMGSEIKCNNCKHSFGKILCPTCGKMNTCTNNFFRAGIMKCGFNNCFEESNLANCIFCRKLNVFDKNVQVNGHVVNCGYCKNKFSEIFCPFCKKSNPFPLADFKFGKVYKCKYMDCWKKFQFLKCPKCKIYSFIEDIREGHKVKCDGCQTIFMNWCCPFCNLNTMYEGSSLYIGQMIKCPFDKCQKIYSFIRCSGCSRLIFSKENENLLGKSIRCPYYDCGELTVIIYCKGCKFKILYKGQNYSFSIGEKIVCKNCNQNFNFEKNINICNGNLSIVPPVYGKMIEFGVGQVDENYLSIQNLFFHKPNKYPSIFTNQNSLNNKDVEISIYNDWKNVNFNECIVCHNSQKESVFYPCGHRCACYNCAVLLFTINKKCPKCNQNSTSIIRKVYE